MELKKSKKANLENKRNTFFLFGLVFTLASILLAFEWTSHPSQVSSLGMLESAEVDEEIIPITREEEVKPPPPPPPPKVVEVLNIVDDDVQIEDELEIEDTEADDETAIDVQPIVKTAEEEDFEDKIWFNILEDPAEFPGGEKALYSYISKNVKYPIIAQENGIQGKVYIKFIVNKSGKVNNAEIQRGVDVSLNKEALRVINNLPDFKPGKQRGKPVKVYYNAVINFTLQ